MRLVFVAFSNSVTFGTNSWKRAVAGALVLAFLISIYRFPLMQLPQVQLDLLRFFAEQRPIGELILMLMTQALGLAIVAWCGAFIGILRKQLNRAYVI